MKIFLLANIIIFSFLAGYLSNSFFNKRPLSSEIVDIRNILIDKGVQPSLELNSHWLQKSEVVQIGGSFIFHPAEKGGIDSLFILAKLGGKYFQILVENDSGQNSVSIYGRDSQACILSDKNKDGLFDSILRTVKENDGTLAYLDANLDAVYDSRFRYPEMDNMEIAINKDWFRVVDKYQGKYIHIDGVTKPIVNQGGVFRIDEK